MSPEIPVYISIAFLIAICTPVYLIAQLSRQYAESTRSTVLFYGIITFFFIYLVTVALASLNGAFSEVSLPPKIVQLTTLPLLLILMGGFFNTGVYKRLLKTIPLDKLILLHRFRFIGGFFIILMFFGQLPPVFALIAGLGDVTTALSSFWVAKWVRENKTNARKLAILWNSFGLLDILVTSTMAILLTKISIETGALGVDVLATFPFCFIPAFAPATIIFLHMSIFRKLFVRKFH